jgi:hypothetical protein
MAGRTLGWTVMATGSALVAGIAAKKILQLVWTKSTGKAPPSNPESPTTNWAEAVGWAVLSGVVYGVARLIATRQAAEYYKRSTGHLPEGLEEEPAV